MKTLYENCCLCPRECGANRLAGERGFCGAAGRVTAARAALHFWEEPCLSGERGSGAVFFSGCSLKCVFCQNTEISAHMAGQELPDGRLADIFLELQEQGAHNLNLVTPTQWLPDIIAALDSAKRRGFSLPVVYNTSGYEKTETLRLLEGYVDIWLPDFKYRDRELAAHYSGAPDYFERTSAALDEMVRQAGPPVFDGEGILRRGVIVRHLLLPGCAEDSRAVLRFLHDRYGDGIWISIMNQYTPLPHAAAFPELCRTITDEEYDAVLDYALDIGIENAYVQEGGTAAESFIPPFDSTGLAPL